jgi:hypothetical protein
MVILRVHLQLRTVQRPRYMDVEGHVRQSAQTGVNRSPIEKFDRMWKRWDVCNSYTRCIAISQDITH